MLEQPPLPRLGADPSAAIIAICQDAKTRLESAADALALTVAVAELGCTMALLEEALLEWAMSADDGSATAARDAIAMAARKPA